MAMSTRLSSCFLQRQDTEVWHRTPGQRQSRRIRVSNLFCRLPRPRDNFVQCTMREGERRLPLVKMICLRALGSRTGGP